LRGGIFFRLRIVEEEGTVAFFEGGGIVAIVVWVGDAGMVVGD
jgi:hypothetical protein